MFLTPCQTNEIPFKGSGVLRQQRVGKVGKWYLETTWCGGVITKLYWDRFSSIENRDGDTEVEGPTTRGFLAAL